jgi:hypothetical protein
MAKPWDPPPLPRNGDAIPDKTFAYVGFTMSRWESLEFELSRLHSLFLGALDETDAMRDYGKGRIFPERLDTLTKAAAPHFYSHPSQKSEGQFDEVLEQARLFADRRNDVAHGIVFRIDQITYFREQIKPQLLKREHYALIPPLYALKPHRATGLPSYAYTSASMDRLSHRLMKLQMRIRALHSGPDALVASPSPAQPEPSDAK